MSQTVEPHAVEQMPTASASAPFDACAEARARMVDSQIRPNMVSDPRIIRAMRELRASASCRPRRLAWPMPTGRCG